MANPDFIQLLQTGDRADVIFNVRGVKFEAHKLILSSRCEYFRTMFQFCDNDRTCTSNVMELSDIEPEVFRDLLNFIYADDPPIFRGEATMALLRVADRYGMDDLKDACETLIRTHLSTQNVIDVLLMAERLRCPRLLELAKSFFLTHIDDVKRRPELSKLQENPSLLLQLFLMV